MNNEDRLKLTDRLRLNQNAIPESLRMRILGSGFPTGSFAFGGYVKDESDIDIVIPHDMFWEGTMMTFNAFISANYAVYAVDEYDEDDGFMALYVKTEAGKILNLIIADNTAEFKVWKRSTKLMTKINQCDFPYFLH